MSKLKPKQGEGQGLNSLPSSGSPLPLLPSAQSGSSSLSSNLDNVNHFIKSVAIDIVATAKAQSEVDQMDLDPSQSKGIKRKTSSSVASDTPQKSFRISPPAHRELNKPLMMVGRQLRGG